MSAFTKVVAISGVMSTGVESLQLQAKVATKRYAKWCDNQEEGETSKPVSVEEQEEVLDKSAKKQKKMIQEENKQGQMQEEPIPEPKAHDDVAWTPEDRSKVLYGMAGLAGMAAPAAGYGVWQKKKELDRLRGDLDKLKGDDLDLRERIVDFSADEKKGPLNMVFKDSKSGQKKYRTFWDKNQSRQPLRWLQIEHEGKKIALRCNGLLGPNYIEQAIFLSDNSAKYGMAAQDSDFMQNETSMGKYGTREYRLHQEIIKGATDGEWSVNVKVLVYDNGKKLENESFTLDDANFNSNSPITADWRTKDLPHLRFKDVQDLEFWNMQGQSNSFDSAYAFTPFEEGMQELRKMPSQETALKSNIDEAHTNWILWIVVCVVVVCICVFLCCLARRSDSDSKQYQES